MGRVKQAATSDLRPLGDQRSWARTNGTYLAGRAYIDGADETAAAIETKWGADNKAVCHGDLRVMTVQYGYSQRDYHKRRKIEQPEMGV
jgi:hypothetical protein